MKYCCERFTKFLNQLIEESSSIADLRFEFYQGINLFEDIDRQDLRAALQTFDYKKYNPQRKMMIKLLESVLKQRTDFNSASEVYKMASKGSSVVSQDWLLNHLIDIDNDGKWIYKAAHEFVHFNFDKALNKLMEIDRTGEWIFKAESEFPHFNFKKGFNKLIEIDRTGEWIRRAGVHWDNFDFEKGEEALIDIARRYNTRIYQRNYGMANLVRAGSEWKKFNYVKALEALKKYSPTYYRQAMEEWPKGIEWVKHETRKVERRAKKMPKKPFGLKEGYSKKPYHKEQQPSFNLDTDKNVFELGRDYSLLDHEKLLDRLIELDKDGTYINYAGHYWPEFNSEKAFKAILKRDETGEKIYEAGTSWKNFPYEMGLDELIKRVKKHPIWVQNLVQAGYYWKKFDYMKALKALKEIGYRHAYQEALKTWPRTPEVIKLLSQEMRANATKMPKKPFGLKESWSTGTDRRKDKNKLSDPGNANGSYEVDNDEIIRPKQKLKWKKKKNNKKDQGGIIYPQHAQGIREGWASGGSEISGKRYWTDYEDDDDRGYDEFDKLSQDLYYGSNRLPYKKRKKIGADNIPKPKITKKKHIKKLYAFQDEMMGKGYTK